MTSQVLTTQQSAAVEAFVRLLHAHAAATKTLSADLSEEHGLSINDYETLLRLSHAENGLMRRVDLARELMLTPSGVTRMLEGLERSGLVEKAVCESDLRVTYAVLTEQGRTLLERASCSHIAAIRDLFSEHYTDAELRTLADLLRRLPGAGEGQAEECTP
jgi:DNA-binding MarR family transcriptional regulator